MITTDAWVLHEGPSNGEAKKGGPAELKLETYSFPDLTDQEVLAEPLYGCWEGNMTHAVERSPVDICRQRREDKVVIGNAGVVRVLKTGAAVKGVKEGDVCLVFCNGVWDQRGYPKKIFGYDAPGTVGLLARRTKLHERQLIPIPTATRHSLTQWAAFSLRYITAWANWKLAYGCWRLQASQEDQPAPFVWGWGGGVTLAELMLARFSGCRVAMISSIDERLEMLAKMGITPIDRRQFGRLHFDQDDYRLNAKSRKAYLEAEEIFLEVVRQKTLGLGVSVFIDFIGLPVFRATVKALARPGVITTAGWKEGMNLSTVRAIECMNWHIHVYTHYARYQDGLEAVQFAEENGWLPSIDSEIFSWDSIPRLAEGHASRKLSMYFPVFQVNPL
jgi:NADPH:quinone reductase-like Zn-dependent oxidoreductase